MPPKKKEEPVEKPVLGRFKSNLKVSFVSLSPSAVSIGDVQPSSIQKLGMPASKFFALWAINQPCFACVLDLDFHDADGDRGVAKCWEKHAVQHTGQSVYPGRKLPFLYH